jgi:hypothetical protein
MFPKNIFSAFFGSGGFFFAFYINIGEVNIVWPKPTEMGGNNKASTDNFSKFSPSS